MFRCCSTTFLSNRVVVHGWRFVFLPTLTDNHTANSLRDIPAAVEWTVLSKQYRMENAGSSELRWRKRLSRSDDATLIGAFAALRQTNKKRLHFDEDGPATMTQPKLDARQVIKKTKVSPMLPSDVLDMAALNFFSADVVTTNDQDNHEPTIKRALEKVIHMLNSKGANHYLDYKVRKKQKEENFTMNFEGECNPWSEEVDNGVGDSSTWCDLRSYQTFLLEIAKERNTIVHLASGTGKTLV